MDSHAIEAEATRATSQELAAYLQEELGQKLTGYMAGVNDVKMVGRWASGRNRPRDAARMRLQVAFHVTRLLVGAYGVETAKAWLVGVNAALGDESPAWIIRTATDPGGLRMVVPLAKEFAGVPIPSPVHGKA